jgi:hypothetical protein
MVITPLAEQVLWIDYATSGNGDDTTNTGDSVSDVLSASNTPTSSESPSSHTSSPISDGHRNASGDIAGGVVGSLAALALLAFVIIFYIRRRRDRGKEMEEILPHQLPLPDHCTFLCLFNINSVLTISYFSTSTTCRQ